MAIISNENNPKSAFNFPIIPLPLHPDFYRVKKLIKWAVEGSLR